MNTPVTPSRTLPVDAISTTDDVPAGVDLSGRRIVVTGGAAGVSAETIRALGWSATAQRSSPLALHQRVTQCTA